MIRNLAAGSVANFINDPKKKGLIRKLLGTLLFTSLVVGLLIALSRSLLDLDISLRPFQNRFEAAVQACILLVILLNAPVRRLRVSAGSVFWLLGILFFVAYSFAVSEFENLLVDFGLAVNIGLAIFAGLALARRLRIQFDGDFLRWFFAYLLLVTAAYLLIFLGFSDRQSWFREIVLQVVLFLVFLPFVQTRSTILGKSACFLSLAVLAVLALDKKTVLVELALSSALIFLYFLQKKFVLGFMIFGVVLVAGAILFQEELMSQRAIYLTALLVEDLGSFFSSVGTNLVSVGDWEDVFQASTAHRATELAEAWASTRNIWLGNGLGGEMNLGMITNDYFIFGATERGGTTRVIHTGWAFLIVKGGLLGLGVGLFLAGKLIRASHFVLRQDSVPRGVRLFLLLNSIHVLVGGAITISATLQVSFSVVVVAYTIGLASALRKAVNPHAARFSPSPLLG